MKTVSREMGKRLEEAGWKKETQCHYGHWTMEFLGGWYFYLDTKKCAGMDEWLPAPTLDEVLEELSYENFRSYFEKSVSLEAMGYSFVAFLDHFSKWLFTTMRSADAAAEVWLKVKGGKP